MEQLKETLKTESIYLLYLLISLIITFQIVFYNEKFLVIFRTIIGFLWLFALPGFSLMYIWKENFDFLERIIFGTVLGIAIVGLSSYYLTLFKINIRWQFIIIPIIIIIVAILIVYFTEKKKDKQNNN